MLWHALSKQHPIVADTMAVVFHSSTPSPSGDGCQPMHVACNLQAALYAIACTTLGLMGAGLLPEAMLNYVQQSRVLLKQLKACNTADQWNYIHILAIDAFSPSEVLSSVAEEEAFTVHSICCLLHKV